MRRVADGRDDYAISQADGRYYVAAPGTAAAGRRAESLSAELASEAPVTAEQARAELERADLRLRIARAQLLLQIARDGVPLADLLTAAGQLGDDTAADTLAAFRAAQADVMQTCTAELERLSARPD